MLSTIITLPWTPPWLLSVFSFFLSFCMDKYNWPEEIYCGWTVETQLSERGTGMQIQYNYVTPSALPELRSLYYVHTMAFSKSRTQEPILCTHLCAFMKICLLLLLYQLIIGGSSPDVKTSIRKNPLASPFLFSTLPPL